MTQACILGPLRLIDPAGRDLPLGGLKPRALLACLAVEPGRVVSQLTIADVLWEDEETPPDVAHNIQTHVSRLRRELGRGPDGRPLIERIGTGYVLRIPPEATDEHRARTLLTEGRALLARGDLAGASGRFAAALDLWRGEPLADLADRLFAQPHIVRLRELRSDIRKAKADADLTLGYFGDVVGALEGPLKDNPDDEGLLVRVARALAGDGRTTDALALLRTSIRRLRDEGGLDVDSLLALQTEILRGTTAVAAPTALPPASQGAARLPPDVRDFTGRSGDRQTLVDLLTARDTTSATVVALSGMPGVGKTALALRVAHEVEDHFPDGALYAELRGSTGQPFDPSRVLQRLLNALGVARTTMPDDLDELEEVFQERLATLRVLIVLDNGVDAGQVRPLLPRAPGCAAIVTSRSRLNELGDVPGLHAAPLTVMRADAAVELLGRTAGADRVEAEPEAARTIIGLCSYLPLAICIAGRKLAARPNWPLDKLVRRLQDERDRLSEFSIGDLALAASFEVSYDERQEEEQRAFRLLGLLDLQDFAPWVAAAVLDRDPDEAEEIVDRLVDANLLEARERRKQDAGSPPRYRFHDLLRTFARERALVRDPGGVECAGAVARAVEAYVAHARAAAALFDPGAQPLLTPSLPLPAGIDPTDIAEVVRHPISWYGTERINLPLVTAQAYANGQDEATWLLAGSLADFFEITANRGDWRATHEYGIDAARRAGNRVAEAVLVTNLGRREIVMALEAAVWRLDAAEPDTGEGMALEAGRRHLVQAEAFGNDALALFRADSDEVGGALALAVIAETRAGLGRRQESTELFQEAVRTFQRHGRRVSEARALTRLGVAFGELTEYDSAVDRLDKAQDIARDLGNGWLLATILLRLGTIRARQGRHALGIECYDRCVPLLRALPDPLWEARAHFRRGDVLARTGQIEEARSAWLRSQALFTAVGSAESDVVAHRLANPGEVAVTPDGRRALPSLPHKELLDRFQRSEGLIRICATWSDLLLDPYAGRFTEAIARALSMGAMARIMLLDPDSDAARLRQRDLDGIDIAARIRQNLDVLRALLDTLDGPSRARIAVRIQQRQAIVYYRCDATAYVPRAMIGNPANTAVSPQWELRIDHDMAREQEDLFESIWDDEETLSLAEYDALRLRVRRRNEQTVDIDVPWVDIGGTRHIVADAELSRLLRNESLRGILLVPRNARTEPVPVRTHPGTPGVAEERLQLKYGQVEGEIVRLEER